MNIYIDSEFTGLKTSASLVSLALIADDGSYFYAEFNDYLKPTDWVISNVIPHLLHDCFMYFSEDNELVRFTNDRQDILENLLIWIHQYEKVMIITDTGFMDWLLLLDLFQWNLPDNVFYIPVDISTLFFTANIDPDINRMKFAEVENEQFIKHNALHDANVIQLCYKKLQEILNDSTR